MKYPAPLGTPCTTDSQPRHQAAWPRPVGVARDALSALAAVGWPACRQGVLIVTCWVELNPAELVAVLLEVKPAPGEREEGESD